MLIYRPPDCKIHAFSDIMDNGDFNMPNNDWANSSPNSSSALHQVMSLLNVTDSLFLEQHIHEPTRNDSILDLVFSSSDLVSLISVHETAISDHNIIVSNTTVPMLIETSVPQKTSK